MKPLVFIVAGDPDQHTGGYLYDARIVAALRHAGRAVEVVGVAGRFPVADNIARRAMQDRLADLADGQVVVIDGLALGTLDDVVAAHAHRLVLIALIHHPLADEAGLDEATAAQLRHSEEQTLARVARVIVTSRFTAERLQARYAVTERRIDIVEPGIARPATPNATVATPPLLLTVASLIPRKGHRVLVDALARIVDRAWQCRLVGDPARDPACAAGVEAAISAHGLSDRIQLVGSLSPEALQDVYGTASLFVLPSFYEGYGMVITEALVHGLPVVTTTGGALDDTLPDDAGLKVAPGDVNALAEALATLLDDDAYRRRLGERARRVGADLPDWSTAAARFAEALDRAVAS